MCCIFASVFSVFWKVLILCSYSESDLTLISHVPWPNLLYRTQNSQKQTILLTQTLFLVSALCRKIWWKYLFLSCHSTLQSSHLFISVCCLTSFPWTVVVTGMFGSNPCVSTVINNTICISYIFKWEEDRENIWNIQRALWCVFLFVCFFLLFFCLFPLMCHFKNEYVV